MTGISISVELQEATARQALRDLLARMENPRGFYKGVGEALLASTSTRFETETGPDGKPWTPLKPATIRARTKAGQLQHHRLAQPAGAGRGGAGGAGHDALCPALHRDCWRSAICPRGLLPGRGRAGDRRHASHRNRSDPGQHLTLRQGSVAHQPRPAIGDPLVGKGGQKHRHFRLDRLLDEFARACPDHLGKRIRSTSRWIGQSGDGIVVHVAYPFLGRELTASRHRHDMPPLRASPTFGRFSQPATARRSGRRQGLWL